MSNPKIAVYSLPDLKNTTDDALPNYLTSLKFKQANFLTDVRLALGYTAVIIAGVTFGLDYKLGWDKTKDLTLYTVIAYFALNTALTYWIWAVEKGKIFTGENEHALISVASHVKKNKPIYNLTIRHADVTGRRTSWETAEISAPFNRWFDADGYFVAQPFQQWLATEIPVIGRADPKHVVKALQEESGSSEKVAAEVQIPTPAKGGAKGDGNSKGGNTQRSTGTSSGGGTRSRKSKN